MDAIRLTYDRIQLLGNQEQEARAIAEIDEELVEIALKRMEEDKHGFI